MSGGLHYISAITAIHKSPKYPYHPKF